MTETPATATYYPDDDQWQTYLSDRDEALRRQSSSSESFDKAILTYSSGGLALSLTLDGMPSALMNSVRPRLDGATPRSIVTNGQPTASMLPVRPTANPSSPSTPAAGDPVSPSVPGNSTGT